VMLGGGCTRWVVGCVECGGDADTAETRVLRLGTEDLEVEAIKLEL
jgi:hypothetical protein